MGELFLLDNFQFLIMENLEEIIFWLLNLFRIVLMPEIRKIFLKEYLPKTLGFINRDKKCKNIKNSQYPLEKN